MIILTLVTAAIAACPNSQPCGNSCISWKYTCHQSAAPAKSAAKGKSAAPKEAESYVVASVDTDRQTVSFSRNGILHTCSTELPDDLAVGAVITTKDFRGESVRVFTYSPAGGDESTPLEWLNVSACSKVSQ